MCQARTEGGGGRVGLRSHHPKGKKVHIFGLSFLDTGNLNLF